MTLLALDPANNLGYARPLPDGGVDYGSVDLTKRAAQLRCSVLAALREWLREQIKTHGVTEIHCEDSAQGSHRHNIIVHHARKWAVIDLTCELAGVKRVYYNPTKIKLHATGSGRADKEQMMAACRTLYGIDVSGDDDAADAIHILKMAEAGVNGAKKHAPAKMKRRAKKPRDGDVGTLFR